MIHENIELTGSLEVSGSFILPLGGDSDREGSPITGSLFYNTASRKIEVYNGTAWVTQSLGGSDGGTPAADTSVEYLVVAGGGGMGNSEAYSYYGGGGGGGGLLSSSFSSLTSGSSYTITVGAGGAQGGAVNVPGNDGGDSSISGTGITTVTATGGGGGGDVDDDGRDGGSGGGAGGNDAVTTGGSGTSGQGNAGGDTAAGSGEAGAGGGGAGGAGISNSTPDINGKNGGLASASAITGTSTNYAGGGGGQRGYIGSHGDYGSTGAGANTGFGGNAQSGESAGDSGVVILAYYSSSIHAAGGISGDAGNGRRYHQFNSSDTFVVGSTDDFNIVTDNLELHFDAADFASRGTSTWTDLSGNGRNGTVSGATLQTYDYTFDGSNDYVYVTNDSALEPGSGGFTLEAWVNNDNVSGQDSIFAMVDSGGTYTGYFLRQHGSGIDFLLYQNSTTIGYILDPGTPLTTGTWHHIVATVSSNANGATMTTYVDGVQQQTATTTGAYSTLSTEQFQIGRYNFAPSTRWWDGEIAQARVYSVGLTQAQVTQNYNATKTNFV